MSSTALVPVDDLVNLATNIAPSTLLPEKLRGKPHDVLAIVMAGRELGLAPWASIRMLNIIEGKPVLTADGMVGLVRGSGKCERWEMIESTDKLATFETSRKGEKAQRLSYTIDEAKLAGLTGKHNWKTFPAAMLRARAQSALARLVYQDVLAGVYSDDEAAEFSRAPSPPPPEVIEPEVEIDETMWQLRISAAPTIDDVNALAPEWDALPKGAARLRLGALIKKRKSELSRAYAAEMKESNNAG